MRSHFLLAAVLAVPAAAIGAPALHDFTTVSIAPDGRHIASIETQDDGSDRDAPATLSIRGLKGGVVTAAVQRRAELQGRFAHLEHERPAGLHRVAPR
jgi:hypothetical protein